MIKPIRLKQRIDRQELDALKNVFRRIDRNGDGFIDQAELQASLDKMSYDSQVINKYGLSEVEEIIWEVDEDLDKKVSWEEFESCYTRCCGDTCGNEPKRLYNIIEFMIHDKDGDGTVDRDECMEIMHRRQRQQRGFRPARLSERLFQRGQDTTQQVLSLTEFLDLMREIVPKQKRMQEELFNSTRTPRTGRPKDSDPRSHPQRPLLLASSRPAPNSARVSAPAAAANTTSSGGAKTARLVSPSRPRQPHDARGVGAAQGHETRVVPQGSDPTVVASGGKPTHTGGGVRRGKQDTLSLPKSRGGFHVTPRLKQDASLPMRRKLDAKSARETCQRGNGAATARGVAGEGALARGPATSPGRRPDQAAREPETTNVAGESDCEGGIAQAVGSRTSRMLAMAKTQKRVANEPASARGVRGL
eukprot:Rmarinus@m.8627